MSSTEQDEPDLKDDTWFLITSIMNTETGRLGKVHHLQLCLPTPDTTANITTHQIDWDAFIKDKDFKMKDAA